MVIAWTAVRHRAECHPYFRKNPDYWLLAVGFTYDIIYIYILRILYLVCTLNEVDTDVLLQLLLYVPAAVVIMLLLYCGWLWCCYCTTAALVHKETEETYA